ncbi:MAG: RraA family protein [Acidimicrobiia bacterium]
MTEYSDRSAWTALGTATISDALDKLGIAGQCFGIAPLVPGTPLAGNAFTVRYGPVGQVKGTVGDYIDDVPAGGVVVLDNGGRLDATVWGDILTEVAHERGIAGTVIDGVCRDTDVARSLAYPISSRSHWMRTGKDRVQVEAVAAPVAIGGVRIEHADWIVGDADGVVAIPAARMAEVFDVARAIDDAEAQIRELVRAGRRLDEARREIGYHTLQSRP